SADGQGPPRRGDLRDRLLLSGGAEGAGEDPGPDLGRSRAGALGPRHRGLRQGRTRAGRRDVGRASIDPHFSWKKTKNPVPRARRGRGGRGVFKASRGAEGGAGCPPPPWVGGSVSPPPRPGGWRMRAPARAWRASPAEPGFSVNVS